MNKKLMITAAALLAFSTLAGCTVKPGQGSNSAGGDSGNPDPSSSSQPIDTKVTVTFDLNYQGAPAPTTVQVEKNDYVDEPDDPTRDNYFFKGWYDTADASGDEFDFFLTPIVEDITLYADWAAAYNVTFYLNKPEAQEQEVYSSSVVEAGELVSRPVDPKIKGYTFGGWYENAACDDDQLFNFATAVSKNLDLYAKWELPDWKSAKAAIDKYLGYLASVEGVTVPQFPNSDYTVDDRYRDALVVSGPDKCIAEYLPILEAAGYTVDAEKNEASNEYITLKLRENDDATKDQFELLVIINGTGEVTEFNDVPYKIGTQQNFIGLPAAALSGFSRFEVYKGNLTTGDPCTSISLYFDEKPEGSTLTDEQYFNQKLTTFKGKLGSSKYNTGYFTDTGGLYFYDKAYLTMNQVDAFDASTPLRIEILSYSYAALYGAGVSLNKIDKATFAAASATALWKTTAAFDVDLSSIAATAAVNGKNFIVEYDVGDRQPYVELDILGVKASDAGLNAVYNAVLNAVYALDDWELFSDGDGGYYAYHYVNGDSGLKSDAKLTLDYSYTSATNAIFGGLTVEVILNPVDTEWDAEFVADYFAAEALPGDNTALPAYTGTFAFVEMETSEYGDYLDIYMKYTDSTEVNAYLESLSNSTYNYSAKGQDATGAYVFASQSGNFEVLAYVGQNSLEIVVNAAPLKEFQNDANGLASANAILTARSAFAIPSEAYALLQGQYSGIEMYSYFDFEENAGYSVVDFISNVVAPAGEGEKTAVENDAEALINYFGANGYAYDDQSGKLTINGLAMYIEATAPVEASGDAEAQPSRLEFTVIGNPPESMDDGHVTKYSSTRYVADNGDLFLMNIGASTLQNLDMPNSYFNSYCKGKVENSQLPSLYAALPDNTAYVSTELNLVPDYSAGAYDGNLTYPYFLSTKLVDSTAEKEVLNGAATAYATALGNAGFVPAVDQLLNYVYQQSSDFQGYWNANSGEFVMVEVDADSNTVEVSVFYTGALLRASYIKIL